MFRRSSIFLQEVPIYSDLVRFLGAVILGFVLVFPSFAQEGGAKTEPFLSWDKTAEQAQTLLERDSVSTDELEAIRSKLAEQRDQAFDRREAGSVEARALEAELNSLGPHPKKGARNRSPLHKSAHDCRKRSPTQTNPSETRNNHFAERNC